MTREEEFLKKSKFFKYMIPPDGVELIERTNDFLWKEESGIYCTVPKDPQVLLPMNEYLKDIESFKKLTEGSGRLCLISVINPSSKTTREQREIVAKILPEMFKALGVISNSALGRMALKVYLGLKPADGYDMQAFPDYDAAKAWVLPYLDRD